MPKSTITHELLFMRCRNWNTSRCPHRQDARMALAAINKGHLFLLADNAVSQLKNICQRCPSFEKKQRSRK